MEKFEGKKRKPDHDVNTYVEFNQDQDTKEKKGKGKGRNKKGKKRERKNQHEEGGQDTNQEKNKGNWDNSGKGFNAKLDLKSEKFEFYYKVISPFYIIDPIKTILY
jgi:hypothetical protein